MSPEHSEDALAELLARHSLLDATLISIAGDASPRSYFRLKGHGLLLMKYQNDPAGFASYLRVSEHLAALGLSAPRVVGSDETGGVALIEDFGEQTYAVCLSGGHDETELYKLGVDVLLHLHHDAHGREVSQPPYDLEVLLGELDIFSDWFAPTVAPKGFDNGAFSESFRTLWSEALDPVTTRFDTLVLRDFHIDNLMLLPGREGVARCGLLDFQDAVVGPCEYDLVSLLQDARRDLSDGLEDRLFSYYLANAPSHLGTEKDIRRRYALLGAQRHARILGVFVRLSLRDGKSRYLVYMARVLGQLLTAMERAELDKVRILLDNELPNWKEKTLTLEARFGRKRTII